MARKRRCRRVPRPRPGDDPTPSATARMLQPPLTPATVATTAKDSRPRPGGSTGGQRADEAQSASGWEHRAIRSRAPARAAPRRGWLEQGHSRHRGEGRTLRGVSTTTLAAPAPAPRRRGGPGPPPRPSGLPRWRAPVPVPGVAPTARSQVAAAEPLPPPHDLARAEHPQLPRLVSVQAPVPPGEASERTPSARPTVRRPAPPPGPARGPPARRPAPRPLVPPFGQSGRLAGPTPSHQRRVKPQAVVDPRVGAALALRPSRTTHQPAPRQAGADRLAQDSDQPSTHLPVGTLPPLRHAARPALGPQGCRLPPRRTTAAAGRASRRGLRALHAQAPSSLAGHRPGRRRRRVVVRRQVLGPARLGRGEGRLSSPHRRPAGRAPGARWCRPRPPGVRTRTPRTAAAV